MNIPQMINVEDSLNIIFQRFILCMSVYTHMSMGVQGAQKMEVRRWRLEDEGQ